MPHDEDAISRFEERKRIFGLFKKKIEQEELDKYRNTDALYDSIFRMTYFTKMLKNETLTDVEKEYFNKQKDKIMEEVYRELKKPIYTDLNVTPDENKTLELISLKIEEIWGTYAEEFFTKYPDVQQQRVEFQTKQRQLKKKEETKEIVSTVLAIGIVGILFLIVSIISVGLTLLLIYFLVVIGVF